MDDPRTRVTIDNNLLNHETDALPTPDGVESAKQTNLETDALPTPVRVEPAKQTNSNQGISPMVFGNCKRGPGRPANKGFGPKTFNNTNKAPPRKRKAGEIETPNEEISTQPKKRGRPKGSRNRVKSSSLSTDDLLRKATRAADPLAVFSDGLEEVCNICDVSFNNPIKKGKKIGNCPDCFSRVHVPCLNKDPCKNCM